MISITRQLLAGARLTKRGIITAKQYDELLSTVYDYTKAVDSTRPCIDTSGNFHVKTDIYDVHDYTYDATLFKRNYDRLVTENELYEHVLLDNPGRQKYGGQPVFVSEYGGIKWETDNTVKSWATAKTLKQKMNSQSGTSV